MDKETKKQLEEGLSVTCGKELKEIKKYGLYINQKDE